MLEKEQIVKLDNGKEYVVVMIDNYDNNEYVYLININDNKEFMFCKHEGNSLEMVKDSDLIEKLLFIFTKKIAE